MDEVMQPTPLTRPWLVALKRLHDDAADGQVPTESVPRIVTRLDETANNLPAAAETEGHEEHEGQAETGANRAESPPREEVLWRVEAMRPQVPARGPIGYLHARPRTAAHDTPGNCGSCGEPKEPSQTFVCRACRAAKWEVLNEVYEDVLPSPLHGQR